MTLQEVILMAMAKKLTWIEASRVLGYTDRHLRRVKARYEREGLKSQPSILIRPQSDFSTFPPLLLLVISI